MDPTADHGRAETTAPLKTGIERMDHSGEIGAAMADLHLKRR